MVLSSPEFTENKNVILSSKILYLLDYYYYPTSCFHERDLIIPGTIPIVSTLIVTILNFIFWSILYSWPKIIYLLITYFHVYTVFCSHCNIIDETVNVFLMHM